MKSYHVYGLGNALLDLELQVSDKELQGLGLDKGVMTLVSAEEQARVLEHFSNKHILKSSGGSAANTIIMLQQLGCSTFYSCKVADDLNGHAFIQDLISQGVSSNLKELNLESGVTGLCLAMVTGDAERTMHTHLGITQKFSERELDYSALRDSASIYIEGYLVAADAAREAAIKARAFAEQNNIMTSLTLSDPNMVKFFGEGLRQMIGSKVDILFCNEAEATLFAQETEVREYCAYLETCASSFIVTRGKQGALLYDGTDYYDIPGERVDVIDTLGAGDAFAGGYLAAIHQGKSPLEAAHIANKVAGKLVTQFGARLKNDSIPKDMLAIHA